MLFLKKGPEVITVRVILEPLEDRLDAVEQKVVPVTTTVTEATEVGHLMLLVTGASLVVTSALLVVTMIAVRIKL